MCMFVLLCPFINAMTIEIPIYSENDRQFKRARLEVQSLTITTIDNTDKNGSNLNLLPKMSSNGLSKKIDAEIEKHLSQIPNIEENVNISSLLLNENQNKYKNYWAQAHSQDKDQKKIESQFRIAGAYAQGWIVPQNHNRQEDELKKWQINQDQAWYKKIIETASSKEDQARAFLQIGWILKNADNYLNNSELGELFMKQAADMGNYEARIHTGGMSDPETLLWETD